MSNKSSLPRVVGEFSVLVQHHSPAQDWWIGVHNTPITSLTFETAVFMTKSFIFLHQLLDRFL